LIEGKNLDFIDPVKEIVKKVKALLKENGMEVKIGTEECKKWTKEHPNTKCKGCISELNCAKFVVISARYLYGPPPGKSRFMSIEEFQKTILKTTTIEEVIKIIK
jgi:spore maturation protein CgeB